MRDISLHTIARAVAEHLPGFEYIDDARQKNADGEYYYCAHLTSTAETTPVSNAQATRKGVLWINRPLQIMFTGSSQRDKIQVSLDTPHVEIMGRNTWTGDAIRKEKLGIHVDPKRAPIAIAKDISRRLMPDATKQWETVLLWLANQEYYANEGDKTREEMIAMGATFSVGREPNQGHFNHGDTWVSLSVTGSTVRFEHMSLTAEQACRVLQALKGKV